MTIKAQDAGGRRYVVFDGEFIEKLPASSPNRRHVSELTKVTVEHKPAKKKLFGGETDEQWQAFIHCGAIFSLRVTAEEKPKLDELTAALQAARADR
jgi:hypothetical protein